jgi:DNA polymerase III subunit epsilon
MDFEKLIFIDLETTGANPAVDRITEIGLVEVDRGGNATHWSSLVNPGVSIPTFIQGLTGISNEMVRTAPSFAQLASALHERLHNALFIAHNARFDYGFLRNAFSEAGYSFRSEVLCTVKLSRALFPDESRHNLDALIARHQLRPDARHRALADADLIWQFWQKLAQQVPQDVLMHALKTLLQRPSLPSHLPSDTLDHLPDTPGVYLFYGENDLPLYVGKSVRLRQRVMSHFSADHKLYKEMRLSQQLHRIEWHETAGEIGALLLEAQLVKSLQPIHNRKLRRQGSLCAWRLKIDDGIHARPELSYASDADFGRTDAVYGLFSSKRKAESKLRELAEHHQLCLVQLGLEGRAQSNKPCFGWQLQRCKGVCIGKENEALHHARLVTALSGLRVKTWPYEGAVGLIEQGTSGRSAVHLVNNWCYLGTAESEQALQNLMENSPARPVFDMDTYKILSKALLQQHLKVRRLSRVTMKNSS